MPETLYRYNAVRKKGSGPLKEPPAMLTGLLAQTTNDYMSEVANAFCAQACGLSHGGGG